MKATANGVEYNLVKMKALPKKGNGSVDIVLNGTPFTAKVTSNKGWNADPATVLEYIWLDVAGTAYYLTLDYAVPASSMKGVEFVTAEGLAKRADPKRVTNKVDVEAARIAKFKVTYAARG
jgi:hypothetical protein